MLAFHISWRHPNKSFSREDLPKIIGLFTCWKDLPKIMCLFVRAGPSFPKGSRSSASILQGDGGNGGCFAGYLERHQGRISIGWTSLFHLTSIQTERKDLVSEGSPSHDKGEEESGKAPDLKWEDLPKSWIEPKARSLRPGWLEEKETVRLNRKRAASEAAGKGSMP